jgi:hypothetical protein
VQNDPSYSRVAQFWLAIKAAQWAISHDVTASAAYPDFWLWLGGLAATSGVVGLLGGSTIFGLNMLYTCRWLRMNRNDAFSALRIGRYNNFVRMRICEDEVKLYAVGLEDVPERHQWEDNKEYKEGNPSEPRWSVPEGLKPHLIEQLTVNGSTTPLPSFP